MYAFPVVIVDSDNSYSFYDGTLFRLSPDLAGPTKIQQYARLTRPGWHTIDFDYVAYVADSALRRRCVFVGLCPREIRPRRKLLIPNFYSRVEFEKYCQEELARELTHYDQAKMNLSLLVHDLRRLSTSIYHAAVEAREYAEKGDTRQTLVRIENCIAAQGMLKLRTDALDLVDNTDNLSQSEPVQIYRKVDKVVRCFKPLSEKKHISLWLDGKSYSSSTGPNIFEIVPYVIIDNAIKYSPHHGKVDVKIGDNDGLISVRISSLGPYMSQEEREKVFQRGFRGVVAQERDDSGSGMGLFLAHNIVERFEGNISIQVEEHSIETSNGPCHEITFEVNVPRMIMKETK